MVVERIRKVKCSIITAYFDCDAGKRKSKKTEVTGYVFRSKFVPAAMLFVHRCPEDENKWAASEWMSGARVASSFKSRDAAIKRGGAEDRLLHEGSRKFFDGVAVCIEQDGRANNPIDYP